MTLKLNLKRAVLTAATLASLTLVAGCSTEAQPYTADEKAKFSAPLGQPMPPEAKAAMERMSKNPGGPPGSAPPAGAPPAAAVPPGSAGAAPAPK